MDSTGKTLTVPVEHSVLSFFVKAGTLYMRFRGFIDRTDAVILTVETTHAGNDPLGILTAVIIRLKARSVPGIVEYTKKFPSNLLVACKTGLVTTTWLPDGKSRSYRNLDVVLILTGEEHKRATYLVLIEVACGTYRRHGITRYRYSERDMKAPNIEFEEINPYRAGECGSWVESMNCQEFTII
jgi:hypothetical protein